MKAENIGLPSHSTHMQSFNLSSIVLPETLFAEEKHYYNHLLTQPSTQLAHFDSRESQLCRGMTIKNKNAELKKLLGSVPSVSVVIT